MENIKREIINAIYENGENLITGPILQEVLLDMVDDSNEKDSQLSQSLNDGITSLSESVAQSIADIPTPDLSEYATTQSVEDSIAALSESVSQSIADIPAPDLSEYAKTTEVEDLVNETSASVKDWVEAKHYLTTASLSGSVTEESVGFMIGDATASVKQWVEDKGYATEDWVQSQGYLTEHQDISGLATTESVTSLSESVAQDFANLNIPDVSGLATTESVTALSESVAESIASIPQPDLSEYATTASVSALSESVAEVAEEVATKTSEEDVYNILAGTGLAEAGYDGWTVYEAAKADDLSLVSESLSASIAAITGSEADLSGYLTTASYQVDSASFDNRISAITGSDLSGYATTESLNQVSESVAALSESVEGYGIGDLWSAVNAAEEAGVIEWRDESEEYVAIPVASSESVAQSIENLNGEIADKADARDLIILSGSVATDIAALSASIADITGSEADLSGYLTTASYQVDSASFDSRINNIITGSGVDLSGYATTESLNEVSESVDILWGATNALEEAGIIEWLDESEEYVAVPLATSESVGAISESVANDITALSASIADITGSTPDLSNYVTYSNLTSSYSNSSSVLDASNGRVQKMELSSNGTLDLSSLEEGDKVSVFVKNAANIPVTLSVPGTLESLPVVYNGEENSGSLVVDEWGWMEITRLADAIYVNASVVLPDYSQFATSASVTAVSESVVALSESINSTVTSLSESVDSTIIALSESVSQSISEITGSGGSADLSGYATTASLYDVHTVTASLDPDSGETRFEIDWSYPNYMLISTIEDYAYIRPTAEPKDGKTYTFMIRPYGGDYPIVLPMEFMWENNGYSTVKVNNEDLSGDLEIRDHVALQLTYYKGGTNQEAGITPPNEMYVNFVKNIPDVDEVLLSYTLIRDEYDEEGDSWYKVRNVPDYLEVSESIAAAISEITGSGGGGDYLPLTGGTVTGRTRIFSLGVGASTSSLSNEGQARIEKLGIGVNPSNNSGQLVVSKNIQVGGGSSYDSGDRCIAVGSSGTNTNNAHYSIAVGENCKTSIYGGFVAGRENVVEGNGAFGTATGFRCRTIAMAGYAGGCRSTASAQFATAIGFGAEAKSKAQVVLGSYNEYDPQGGEGTTGSYAVILGAGKSSTWNQDNPGDITRMNALAIKWDGGIEYYYSGSKVILQDQIADLYGTVYEASQSLTDLSESVSQSLSELPLDDNLSSYSTTASVLSISESIDNSIIALSESVSQSIGQVNSRVDVTNSSLGILSSSLNSRIDTIIAASGGIDPSAYALAPTVLYKTDGTTGLSPVNVRGDSITQLLFDSESWQITDLDFSSFDRIDCYIKGLGLGSTIVTVVLDNETANSVEPAYLGYSIIPDSYRMHGTGSAAVIRGTTVSGFAYSQHCSVAVDSTKTKLQFVGAVIGSSAGGFSYNTTALLYKIIGYPRIQ